MEHGAFFAKHLPSEAQLNEVREILAEHGVWVRRAQIWEWYDHEFMKAVGVRWPKK